MSNAPITPPGLVQATADTAWHGLASEDALGRLGAAPTGLTQGEAARRLAEHGPNTLPAAAPRSALLRFLSHFKDVLIQVLLCAAAITATLGYFKDSFVILCVLLVNAIIAFIQEGRAEQALNAIRGMLSPEASALRDGARVTVSAADLVPGDIVLLEPGDRIPADLRLLRARGLRVEEAALTGEAVPVDKAVAAVAVAAPLGDRSCMAFSGTLVAAGQGMGLVVATGAATEIGRISGMLSSVQTLTTPLLRQMNVFAKRLIAVILGLAVLMFGFAWQVRGFGIEQAFMAVVGIAVASIPEGLPAVMTITLAIGVRRMAARHAIVRQLPAVETLGAVSVICSDKTGTLTRNEMAVAVLDAPFGRFEASGSGYAPEGAVTQAGEAPGPGARALLQELAQVAALCNDAALRGGPDGGWTVAGDPMEGAMLAFAARAGLVPEAARLRHPRRDEIPFDSRHRYMATLHDGQDAAFICVKGAPERVIDMCAAARGEDGAAPLDATAWCQRADALAGEGLRVIAVATRTGLPHGTDTLVTADIEGQLVLLGLLGLIDPPRAEAVAAVAECQAAGIRVKMITGDHAATASAIARQVRLRGAGQVITGAELDTLDDATLRARAQESDVFARTSPEHKLRLVAALQADGAVVAMTGDGVNDAPALKRADVGVAMGRKGTEAAKQAADMVLADDNFATIAAAVRAGRNVYDNLTKTVTFLLPVNGSEAASILLAILLGTQLPITPTQILWVNMVSSVALALTLAFEPTEPGTMRLPPRPADQPLLTGFVVWRIVFVSALFCGCVFGMFHYAIAQGMSVETARTMAVNTLIAGEVAYLFSVRHRHGLSLTWHGLFGTPAVLIGVTAVILLQLLFTYAPPLQALFASAPLDPVEAGLPILAAGLAVLAVLELEKSLLRRYRAAGGRAA
jgi:magnesium-transporting ATPase (P-type)